MMRLAVLLAATAATMAFAVAAPSAALAQAPAYLPSHDVAVRYRVSGRAAQQVRELKVRFSAARQLLRVETEDRGMGYVLVDPGRRNARLIVPGLGQYVDLPLARDRRAALLFGDGLQFTRRGRARVSGLECTNWDVRAERDTATLCLTQDGVLLRARGHSGDLADSSLEATRVDATPQAANLFNLPRQSQGLNLQEALRPFLQQGPQGR